MARQSRNVSELADYVKKLEYFMFRLLKELLGCHTDKMQSFVLFLCGVEQLSRARYVEVAILF